MELTQKQLKSLLSYNKDTGIFTWLNCNSGSVKKGDTAGNINHYGYMRIGTTINGKVKRYLAHRLAWLYVHGSLPRNQIDHINHDRLDNRIINLREATHEENQRNKTMQLNNKSGVTGVSFHKPTSKWRSHIQVNGKSIHLGLFIYKNDAICARLHANRLYKFHSNHGKCNI